jgi:hypothetical protein
MMQLLLSGLVGAAFIQLFLINLHLMDIKWTLRRIADQQRREGLL